MQNKRGRIKNPKYSVFINGRTRGRISASRGPRQGDPLSPFLFLSVSEVLSSLFSNLYKKETFKGFVVGKDKIHIPILQFADNTLLFCKFDEVMMENLRKTLLVFEWCSGQKLNREKSSICGINIENSKILSTANNLNCKVESLSFTYLSLPSGGYSKSAQFFFKGDKLLY